MFPPSRVEPAVASATETHKERFSAGKEKEPQERRIKHRWTLLEKQQAQSSVAWTNTSGGNERCRQSRHREMGALYFGVWLETTSFVVPVLSQRLTQRTHLPTHGCQSTRGWLQDISLSVSTYQHLHTSCGVLTRLGWWWGPLGLSGVWGGPTEDPGLMDTEQWRQFQILLDPSPHWWQTMTAARLCFYIYYILYYLNISFLMKCPFAQSFSIAVPCIGH